MQVNGGDMLFVGVWGEITLATLRTLTSLTHENDIAARELETTVAAGKDGAALSGLDIVARVLHSVVRNGKGDSKVMYDSMIFCLNILTNAVESGGSCRFVAQMTMPSFDGESNIRFLAWLTRWLVGETRTFRDAVVESTFGSSPSKHAERELDGGEKEKLMTAGNGFVFLVCLLVDEKRDIASEDPVTADKLIMDELPGEDRDGKVSFLKNTLKAFCNLYHYSVGDLSVAVVAPVKILIKRLEAVQETQRLQSLQE